MQHQEFQGPLAKPAIRDIATAGGGKGAHGEGRASAVATTGHMLEEVDQHAHAISPGLAAYLAAVRRAGEGQPHPVSTPPAQKLARVRPCNSSVM